jgi:Domain of unknown function (DUF4129)
LTSHLAVAALLALAAQPARGSSTLDRAGYVAELNRVAAEVSSSTAEQAAATAAGVPDRWIVDLGGQVVTVDMTWLDAEVTAGTANRDRWLAIRDGIRRRLTTLRDDASESDIADEQKPDAALESVLARPEFQRSATSGWLERQRRQLGAWILDKLNAITGSRIGSRAFAIALAWTASLLALGVLSLWLVRALTSRSRATELDLGVAVRRAPAREWALRALAAARDGNMREAVRCAYHAAINRLDEEGTWTVDESRTPREYLRLVAAGDPRHSALSELTRQFEQIWYGHRPGTADDAQRVAAHLERLGCVRASDRAI